MRRTSTLVLGLTMLAVLALAASGCGGGKKSAASTTTEGTTTEATVQATTEAATTDAATTQATTTTTSSKLGGIASVKNCRELATLGQKFSAAFTGAANAKDFKTEAKLLKEFAAKTPS